MWVLVTAVDRALGARLARLLERRVGTSVLGEEKQGGLDISRGKQIQMSLLHVCKVRRSTASPNSLTVWSLSLSLSLSLSVRHCLLTSSYLAAYTTTYVYYPPSLRFVLG